MTETVLMMNDGRTATFLTFLDPQMANVLGEEYLAYLQSSLERGLMLITPPGDRCLYSVPSDSRILYILYNICTQDIVCIKSRPCEYPPLLFKAFCSLELLLLPRGASATGETGVPADF